MRHPRLSLRLPAVLLALVTALAAGAGTAATALAVDGATYVQLTNVKRASVGKPPVTLVSIVDQISVERANQMAAADLFEHDLDYVTSRLNAAKVCWTRVGEIIAWERGYATYDPQRTIDAWWASPGHHDIMVGDYNAAGGSHSTSSKTGTIYSVMVFVKLCSAPASSTASTSIKRLAGDDRYETAVAISRSRFSAGVPVAYIATGSNFPDALAGAAAAGKRRGPVLLTGSSSLPSVTATELARLKPQQIVVLGSSRSVSDGVLRALRGYSPSVSRIGGADRYATAALVSAKTFATGVPVAYVATGTTFPDALAGGGAAGLRGGPVLLTAPTALPSVTATELARLKPGRIVVLGSSRSVSDTVKSALTRYATSGSVVRVAGADRYATAVALSKSTYGSGSSDVFVATGANFPDGLAGGPVSAIVPGPLLLVAPTSLPSVVATELQRLDPDRVTVLGSSAAVSGTVVSQIDAVLP